jgi:hypothetical protein
LRLAKKSPEMEWPCPSNIPVKFLMGVHFESLEVSVLFNLPFLRMF